MKDNTKKRIRQPKGLARMKLTVRVTENENIIIKNNAENCSLPVAVYLRNLGMGYTPKSKYDALVIVELSRLGGSINKIGGLLKMALADEDDLTKKKQLNAIYKEIIEMKNKITEGIKNL